MVVEFKFPDVGEGITEGRIKKWLVGVGDKLVEDQSMAEVETDKAMVEMQSPADGKVLKILVPEGEKVQVGEVMVIIGDEGEPVPENEVEEKSNEESIEEEPEEESKTPQEPVKSETSDTKPPVIEGKPDKGVADRILALPGVRRKADEKGIDLSKVRGTGPGGRILYEDLDNYQKKIPQETTHAEKPQKSGGGMKVKLNYDFYGHLEYASYQGLREIIGSKLTNSKFTIPHANAMDEVDMTALWDFRKGMNEEINKDNEESVKLSFMPFIVRAVVKALMKHPTLNSTLDEENEEILLKKYYNIGIATDTDDGLIVPVLKRCETKDLTDLQKDMNNLIRLTRDRKIDLADLRGGTFTITNFGAIGGNFGVPIINFPEAAILGTGKIRELPRVVDGEIVVRRIMGISVSFDHRIVDGAEVARFMNTLKEYLENPGKLMA